MSLKTKTILAVSGLTLAVALFFFLGLPRSVMFVINGHELSARVRALTIGSALKAAGIPLDERDVLQPSKNAWLKNGQQITIRRARDVSIQVLPEGETSRIVSAGLTAAELLMEAEVRLEPNDRLWANGELVTVQEGLPPGADLALVIRRAQTIELQIGVKTQTILSSAATLGEALAEAGILLAPADRLTPDAETPMSGPINADLRRTVKLTIQVDVQVTQARSAAENVGEALAEAGISLQGLDYSLPAADQPIPADGRLRVVRVNEELVMNQTSIPFTIKYENSDQVALDQQDVIVPGILGITVSRERVRLEDGQEISRQSDGEWVAQEAKEQIVGLGTKIELKTVQTEQGNLEYYRAVNVYVTSYSPCRSGADRCYTGTSSGLKVQKGVIAVPRAWYGQLVGARVYVPGYGVAVIADTGGMTGYWIDVAYSDEDYVPWSQYVTLYFLAPVPAYVPVRLP
ncbi:MAG TPA: ubiquitin-like domain-containing protein [Longilinea sp.]|nr:ubiquitin-like domain-containing protein [Longilinea sp.]